MMRALALPVALSPRAAELFNQHLADVHRRTSRMFAGLMLLQVVACIAAALWISPLTWIGEQSLVHRHVWIACLFGPLLAAMPVALALARPGWWLTRHTVGIAQMMFSALLIHLTGGRIETHFHVFGSLAFLAFYRDWRVLVTASAVIAADHWWRGVFWPQSVFGSAFTGSWRWLEHAAWVVFLDIFLVAQCLRGVREVRAIACDRAQIEGSRDAVEEQVRVRTRQLAESQAAAESANVAKSAFLANMSHEIRTPMTAILGYTDLLRAGEATPDEHADYLSIIRRNGEHLLSVINDILDLSKIEAGRLTIERTKFSLCALVAEIAATMRVRAVEKGIALEVEYVFPVPERIESDPLRVRQMLMNLVGNAIKFTDTGSVTIRVRADRAADGVIAIDVIDTGIGLDPAHAERLFQPFTQADESTTRRFGGTGLGLSISQKLAIALGGDITLASRRGEGSTFTITLRTGDLSATRMIANAREAVLPEPAPAAPVGPDPTSQLRGRILLAEDGADNRRLISSILRRHGALVECVDNGEEVLATAADSAFDLILMDMQMPILDGYQAVARLRARGVSTPVIALTAHAMAEDRAKCLEAGCTDYASKPIDRDALVRLCARWLNEPETAARPIGA